MLRFCILFCALLFSLGCTSLRSTQYSTDQSSGVQTELDHDAKPAQVGEDFEKEKKIVESHLGDIPIEVNQSVLKWIDYFQNRGRKHMVRYLERSSRYVPYMKSKLREGGVPEELVYIALIESGFNSKAHSRASAVGYWQFIRGTGKRYGLKINSYIDERRDFVRSTEAASLYFKALYNLFGNWYLAMASYNAGENRIKNAVMRNYTRDFWELAQKRQLPKETINYVPKYLAATLIATNPVQYGFTDIDYKPALNFGRVELNHGISLSRLAKAIRVDHAELKKLNPAIKRDYIPYYSNGKSFVNVPTEAIALASQVMDQVKAKTPRVIVDATEGYRVRRGDNLTTIAKRFGTTVSQLRRINNLGRRSMIRVGQRLNVPEKDLPSSRSYRPRNPVNVSEDGYHIVRSGENLSIIARKYGLSVSELKRINNIGRRSLIRVGQRLKVSDSPTTRTNYRSSRKRYHVVRRGDNLTKIAEKYGVTVGQIARTNSIKKRSKLYVGRKLVINH